ncbi:MAG TPA: hypothetical protein VGC34_03780, partial [Steroidobacteraceae bacterium]
MRRRFMRGVQSFAVGSAIARTIHAVAEGTAETTESWVQFCIKAGDEAYAEVMENPPTVTIESVNDPHLVALLNLGDGMSREDNAKYGTPITNASREYQQNGRRSSRPMDGEDLKAAADAAAAMAFRCCMPQLTGRRRAQAYFACVAAGLQRGHFKGAEAKAMLHSAQLALNAFPKRQPRPREQRKKAGFEV